MVRKTVSAVLIFILMLMLCPNAFAKSYPDIEDGTTVYKAVDYLSEIGIIDGYDDGLFRPDGEITRGEAAALLGRSIGYTEDYEVKPLPFKDVKEGYWAERFISYCFEKGLINGMEPTLYCPADRVTYAQIVKMLICASNLESEVKSTNGKWYEGYINTAENEGILENVSITPDNPAKRGDAAILVYNCFRLGLIEDLEEEPPTLTPEPDEEEDSDEEGEEEETPTPKPTPVVAYKEDVVFKADIDEDYVFSKETDYTPEISEDDIDYSGLDSVPENKKLLVVIDPGHNFEGTDVGAHNTIYDVWEQHITWPVAKMLEQKLISMGFDVVMTRDNYNDNIKGDSVKEALLNRAGIANGLEADIFVSIHCNAGGGKGVETYCYKTGTKAEELAEAVQEYLVDETGLYDRGVKTAGFVVIKETLMPAILVETAFIDTESDFEFLISRKGQNKVSTAIAKGVLDYALSK